MKELQAKRDQIRVWVQSRMTSGDPEPPPKKKFSPKFNLPVLNSYRGNADDRYWRYWPRVSWEDSRKFKSQINPDKLWQMAIDTGFSDRDLLKQVCDDLKQGADIGCREECVCVFDLSF